MIFRRVLIANRGEIACRIQRTLRRLGIESVAVYSEADRHAMHVRDADYSFCLGPPPAAQSYLRADRIVEAARKFDAEAIHPGYGFLSENAAFARVCEAEGIRFVGPRPEHIEAFGKKHVAREIAIQNGVPIVPGTPLLSSVDEASEAANRIGFPVMLKSTAGGGGIGMQRCMTPESLRDSFESVARVAGSSFGETGLFLEKLVMRARHIEVQIFGDLTGQVVALGERDCSVQRRNQKVIEETPAPGLAPAIRDQLLAAAIKMGRAVGYRSAGTVEFLFDADTNEFYFLEVNTRLQVEHAITEAVTGLDLVEWMLRDAADEGLPFGDRTVPKGHAIEVRAYAEDPLRNYQPSSGLLTNVVYPSDLRVDGWVEAGTEVLPFYDPLLAKLIVHGKTRRDVVGAMDSALSQTRLDGLQTNLELLRAAVRSSEFEQGNVDTGFLARLDFHPHAMEVIDGGMQTSVQDYPGRLGLWHVGVPPSGPMDALAFRLANRMVGNDEGATALEMTMMGPALKFHCDTLIAIAGAEMEAKLDGVALRNWQGIPVRAGATLRIGMAKLGARAYLAVQGGIDVPQYLGSASTFMLGGFGGHAGRALRAGDVLPLRELATMRSGLCQLPSQLRPTYTNSWTIGVMCGPHGAPEFFLADYIETFFRTEWSVHFHSDRTGVRLVGPKPGWARTDGGEAGLHPSNLHDNAYAIGTLDFTGDTPIILGPDGPSLGGFVCPATIVQTELWKVGQLRAGDKIRFRRVTQETAERMAAAQDLAIETLQSPFLELPQDAGQQNDILLATEASGAPALVIRADGDRCLLIELGPNQLDLELRVRAHALQQGIEQLGLKGIIDLTPGIRSLHIHYDTRKLQRAELMQAVETVYRERAKLQDIKIEARTLWLPLSWDDPSTQEAVARYTRTVRPDAPWAPSNIEFIRRINGLASTDDVRRIVFDASYVVLGLGDVYLGAPVATPVDPRHRLVTTKYNPARTWTPQNAVGIGGAYMCIYGMESPGGLSAWLAVRSRFGIHTARRSCSKQDRRGCCASSIRFAITR